MTSKSAKDDLKLKTNSLLASGDMFALFEQTREAMALFPEDPDVRYLQALAMARLGDPRTALQIYESNRVEDICTEDAAALKGRLLKDLAVKATGSRQSELFRQSSKAYQSAHDMTGGYFSGINAATTAFLAGDLDEGRLRASALLERPEILDPNDYFAAASGAEATLVCGNVKEAIARYKAARSRPDAAPGLVASTARQVGLIADNLSLSSETRNLLLESIRPSPVIHFCGHMLVSGWQESEIVKQIAALLDECDVQIAYGSLACGADILIAEAVLNRGGELHVVLPFAEEDFLTTSIQVGGAEWSGRFARVRDAATSVTNATKMRYVGNDEQFAYCAKLTMGLAKLRAQVMQTQVFQVAVWDGMPPTRIAGTAADCAEWARQNGLTRVIKVPKERPPLNLFAFPERQPPSAHSLHSIIFADFFGFSRLDEDCMPRFLEAVMARIGRILDRRSSAVLSRNSWGDAIFVVVTSPEEAADIAIEIQETLSPKSLRNAGLPAEGGMRMSLHYGPIFEHFDAIRGAQTYYGTEVTLAARIEPRVPVGAIYTTEPFAAMFDHSRDDRQFQYVGKMDLAKDYGVRTLYRLGASAYE